MFIKATFYNANSDYFMSLVFVFEFTRGGTVNPSTRTGVVRNAALDGTALELLIEFTVIGIYVYFAGVQGRTFYQTVRKHRSVMPYFGDVWNVVELAVLSGFTASLTVRFLMFSQLYPGPIIFEPNFIDFSYLGCGRFRVEPASHTSYPRTIAFFAILHGASFHPTQTSTSSASTSTRCACSFSSLRCSSTRR